MRPQTIRRLLVFAVCCAGVAALYLLPGTAESPDQVTSGPGTQPDPPTRTVTKTPEPSPTPQTASPTATPTPTATTTVTASPSPTSSKSATPDPTSSSSPPEDDESDSPSPSPTPTATPTDDPEDPEPEPTDDPTSKPPERVTGVTEIESTHDELTIGWDAAGDDEGLKGYVIYLNEYAIKTQPAHLTVGTIGWEINTEDGYTVKVAAVDNDDQEGPKSKGLNVDRPEEPSPSPDPPGESPDPPNLVPPPEPTPSTDPEPTG